MLVRRANIGDAAAICEISGKDLGYACSMALVSKRLQSLDSSREAVFVAQIGEKTAGYIHAERYEVLYSESMVNILGLAVSSAYRRQGVGKALLHQAEAWAREQGIFTMRLNSGGSRKEAHCFYRAMGYDNEKEQIRFIKNLQGSKD